MTNHELVERVARAAWSSVQASDVWKHRSPTPKEACDIAAHAAIATIAEALSVPTVEMLVAGTEDWLCIRAMEERAEASWHAMLTASPLYGDKDNE